MTPCVVHSGPEAHCMCGCAGIDAQTSLSRHCGLFYFTCNAVEQRKPSRTNMQLCGSRAPGTAVQARATRAPRRSIVVRCDAGATTKPAVDTIELGKSGEFCSSVNRPTHASTAVIHAWQSGNRAGIWLCVIAVYEDDQVAIRHSASL